MRTTILALLLAVALATAGCLGGPSADDDLDAQSSDPAADDGNVTAEAPVCDQAGEVLWSMDAVRVGADGTGLSSGSWGDASDDLASPCELELDVSGTSAGFWELEVEANGTTMRVTKAGVQTTDKAVASEGPVDPGAVDVTFTYTGTVDLEATLTAR